MNASKPLCRRVLATFIAATSLFGVAATSFAQSAAPTTDLTNIKVNPEPALGDRDFALPQIDEGKWEKHTEPYEN